MGKVLIYALSEVKGGVEEFTLNLTRFKAQNLTSYGYAVLGTKTIYEEELNKLGVDYYYIPPKSKIMKNIKETCYLLKKLRSEYDTIYFNTSGLYNPIPYIFAHKYKYKIVIHSHLTDGPIIKRYIHIFNRWWIKKITYKKMACSSPAAKWMFGDLNEVVIIPNAIDLDRFGFDSLNRFLSRKEFGVTNEFVIGNIGRLTKFKNQKFLIDIISELNKINVKSKLVLIGDGEDKTDLEKYADKLKISESVIFLGRKDNPEYYMSGFDLLIMPSIIEGFPITLIEAQANGLPCLVSDSITSETNVSNQIVYISLEKKPAEWCEKIDIHKSRYECRDKLKEKGYDVKSFEQLVYQHMSS